ncbi:MAG: 60S ribosomal protein L23, variant 2 [Marteilia pararefringens]
MAAEVKSKEPVKQAQEKKSRAPMTKKMLKLKEVKQKMVARKHSRIVQQKKTAVKMALDAKVNAKIGNKPKVVIKQRFKPRFYTNTNTLKQSKKPKAPKRAVLPREKININNVLISNISTEAATKNVELANTLVMHVHKQATKPLIKQAFLKIHNVKLVKVNTLNSMKGIKKAFCRLPHTVDAFDMVTKLSAV